MHYNTKSNNVCADKINCCYRVTTVSVFECIEIEKKKALKPLRFKAFFMKVKTYFDTKCTPCGQIVKKCDFR